MHEVNQIALWQIAESAPRAMPAYLLACQQIDKKGSATIARSYIEQDKSMSWIKFTNDIKSLGRIGLLEWHKAADMINITLAYDDF